MESGAGTGRRRRRTWPWVLAGVILLFLLTVGTIVLVLVAAPDVSSGESGGVEWEEEYVSGSGASEIAALPVVGTITGESAEGPLAAPSATPEALQSQLDQAADDESVEAVILEVNTPGGGVVASDEMYEEIQDFKRNTDIPVVVSMQDTAASGGYYISAAADHIVANESTFTGSIGVILPLVNFSEASERYGVDQVAITSGEFKDIGSPWDEVSSEEREILQGIVDDSYNQFVEVVAEGRDLPEDRVREIADGRIYSGLQAEELGLVDELGNLDTAVEEAQNLANVEQARVVRYVEPPSLFEELQARIAPQEPEAVQVMEAAGLDPTPELQYVYRPGLYEGK